MNVQQLGQRPDFRKMTPEQLHPFQEACEKEVEEVLKRHGMGIVVTRVERYTPDGAFQVQIQLEFHPVDPSKR